MRTLGMANYRKLNQPLSWPKAARVQTILTAILWLILIEAAYELGHLVAYLTS